MAAHEKSLIFQLLGDSRVGKSSLLHKYAKGEFYESSYVPDSNPIKKSVGKVQLTIKDVVKNIGMPQRKIIEQPDGLVCCFDLTNTSSLQSVTETIQQNFANDNVPVILVGTKLDSVEKKDVNGLFDKIQKYVNLISTEDNSIQFIVTSAKGNKNVEEVFKKLTEQVLKANSPKKENLPGPSPFPPPPKKPKKSSKCRIM